MLEIKKAVYQACVATGYKVYDYLPQVDTYPYIMLTTSNNVGTDYKNAEESIIYYTIDIFSNSKGELEVIQIQEQIQAAMKQLMSLGQVITIKKEQFSIINDIVPNVKHGIIIYKIQTMEV